MRDAEKSTLVIIDLKVRPDSIDEAKNALLAGISFIRTFEGSVDATLHVNQMTS